MLPAFIIAVVFSVPLAAIIGAYIVKLRRMELEAGGGEGRETDARLRALEAENRDLRTRVEVLETIVTSDDPRAAAKVRMVSSATDYDDDAVPASTHQKRRTREGT